MIFKNKKILIFCKEDYSFPLYFVVEKLKKHNQVAVFWSLSTECYLKKHLHNKDTYYYYRENLSDVKFYDVSEITEQFINSQKKIMIDWDYVKMIEKKYTHFKNLNHQLMSSQFTSTHTHYREYFKKSSYEENIFWLELNYKNQIRIMEEYTLINKYQDTPLIARHGCFHLLFQHHKAMMEKQEKYGHH